ncbi:MAG: hypothetical protein U0804_13330 [Gemmataceae bacterium]
MPRTVTAALAGCLILAGVGPAQPPGAAAEDKQVVTTKPGKSNPAAAVKFRQQLALPYPSLSTLGSRIDAARRAGDPVALGHAAAELKVSEQVAGKTASLTSQAIMKEAAELAALRRQAAEMKAVLQMSNQVTVAEQNLAELKQQLAINEGIKQGIQKYEEPKKGPRTVVVNNYTTQYIDVQVNGYLRGQVLPGSTRAITIDQMWNPIILKGWGDSDETTFGPVVLQGRFTTYTWNINGDDAIPNTP